MDCTFYCEEAAVGIAAYNLAGLLDIPELAREEDCYSSTFVTVRFLNGWLQVVCAHTSVKLLMNQTCYKKSYFWYKKNLLKD